MAMCMEDLVSKTFDNFIKLTRKPEEFLSSEETTSKKFRSTAKEIYDFSKSNEFKSHSSSTLTELIIENFDDEQVWQELELQNEFTVNKLLSQVAGVVSGKEAILFSKSENLQIQNSPHTAKYNKKELSVKHKRDSGDTSVLHTKVTDESGKNVKNLKDIDDEVENELENSGDSDSDNTDDELDKIKLRLKEADKEESDNSENSDLDFDFGDFGKDFAEEEESDPETADIESDEGKEFRQGKSFEENEDGEVENAEIKRFKDSLKKNRKTGSVVDDKFFKLADLETFLDQEDAREEKSRKREEKIQKGGKVEDESSSEEEEDIDMFGDLPSDDSEEENVKSTRDFTYEDFFDPPDDDDAPLNLSKTKKVRFKSAEKGKDNFSNPDDRDYESDDDDDDDDDIGRQTKQRRDLLDDSDSEGEDVAEILGGKQEEKSTFEKRQEKLKKKISEMEEASLKEKPWQLSGEASSSARPENSLLEEHVMFDHTTRLPPVITEETTKTLEDIIKQRIKDKVWDDVERKVKPKEDPFEYKKRIVLDQEKSKQSLGEIYEQEYLKQQQKEEEDKEEPAHGEIKKMMQSLFVKLDALSNFHYTPKQTMADVKIVSNLPSISMEEVAPVSVSESKLLAPEEVQDKVKGELKGKTEKSTTDKKRDRRIKKAEKRKRQKERAKKQKLIENRNPGSAKNIRKEDAMKQMEKQSKSGKGVTVIKDDKKSKTSLTSSKSFFTQLQEEVTTQIKTKKSLKRSSDKSEKTSSKKLKL